MSDVYHSKSWCGLCGIYHYEWCATQAVRDFENSIRALGIVKSMDIFDRVRREIENEQKDAEMRRKAQDRENLETRRRNLKIELAAVEQRLKDE